MRVQNLRGTAQPKATYSEIPPKVVTQSKSSTNAGVRVDQLEVIGITAIPTLLIARADSNVRLSWLASALGFTLQETGALPAGWINSTISITVSGNENAGLAPIAAGANYFRLIR